MATSSKAVPKREIFPQRFTRLYSLSGTMIVKVLDGLHLKEDFDF